MNNLWEFFLAIVAILIGGVCFFLLQKKHAWKKTCNFTERNKGNPIAPFHTSLSSKNIQTELPTWMLEEFDNFSIRALSYEIFKRSLKAPLSVASEKKLTELPREMAPPPLLLTDARRKSGWHASQVEKIMKVYYFQKTGKIPTQTEGIDLLIENILVREAEIEADKLCGAESGTKQSSAS